MNLAIHLRCSSAVLLLALTCLGLSPARAVTPPPDGGYPGNNTAEGDDALFNLTTGTDNTAIGFEALFSNTIASFNTATGSQALFSNTTGISNTATGFQALQSNTTGGGNTAVGLVALRSNTIGSENTATGTHALEANTGGTRNTANGMFALYSNTLGTHNTASGRSALQSNTTGSFNTAYGAFTLSNSQTSSFNTATGYQALVGNSGNGNTATGFNALSLNDGNRNTANGVRALELNQLGNSNVAVGAFALSFNVSGSFNTALGFNAGSNLTTGNNNIDIGNAGVAGESATIRIGMRGQQSRTFIAGIRGVSTEVADAIPVLIDSAGQLGTMSSAARFKREIKPMDRASEAVLSLNPVTYHYKSDKADTPQFGLIAEEVAKVNPHLVVRHKDGEIYSVRYEAVNAMLLNEFLKEHRKVEKLEATVAQQQKNFQSKLADQEKQIEALTLGLQKVSAQLEASKPTPQVVANNP